MRRAGHRALFGLMTLTLLCGAGHAQERHVHGEEPAFNGIPLAERLRASEPRDGKHLLHTSATFRSFAEVKRGAIVAMSFEPIPKRGFDVRIEGVPRDDWKPEPEPSSGCNGVCDVQEWFVVTETIIELESGESSSNSTCELWCTVDLDCWDARQR